MEGQDALQFGYGTPEAKPVTVSFWVKSKVAGKYSLSIEVAPGTQDYRTCIKSYVINHADEWEHKVVTFPPLTTHALAVTDHELGWKVTMPLAVGSTWHDDANEGRWRTDGTYMMGLSGCTNPFRLTGDIFFMTGMQIEVGSIATPFEHRPYGEELALCKRYYHRLSGDNGDQYAPINFWMESAGAMKGSYEYPIEMRDTPTITVSGSWTIDGGTSGNPSVTLLNNHQATAGKSAVRFEFLGSFDARDGGVLNYGSGGVIQFDAEF